MLQRCRIPNWGPLWVALAPPGQPDKQRLMDVKEFFAYTEKAGEGPAMACTQVNRSACRHHTRRLCALWHPHS